MQRKSELLSLEAVADLLKAGVPAVQSLIDRGILESQAHGRQTTVPRQAVLMFLREDQRKLLHEQGQAPDQSLLAGDELAP